MNPLASTKCAARLLMTLAVISGLFLTAGCGSSSKTATNPQGFSVASLNGTYVISVSGTDVNTTASTASFFAIVGTITTDGKGNITGGTVDINDADLGGSGVFTGQAVSASTYSVGQDGRTTANLVTPEGTFGLDFVLSSSRHGLLSRFDSAGSGSGTIDIQGSASQSALTSLAFTLSGWDSNGNPLGTVGAFTLNSSGDVTSGTQDFNDNGSAAGLADLPLATTSSLVLTSSTNGTAQLDSSAGTLTFDVWVIDSTHLKLIETDTSSGAALYGDAFPQQTSFTAGQLVYTMSGLDSSGNPFVAGGYVTADASGNLTNGVEDYNDNGNAVGSGSPTFTGSCATFAAGRCQLALTGFSNGSSQAFTFAAYPSTGGVLLLEDDSLGFAQGAAYAQSATSLTSPEGYALNLSGVNFDQNFNSWFEVDDIAQFNASNSNLTGVLDENDLALAIVTSSLSGTYSPDSPATGRGLISVSTPKTFIGGFDLAYYVVDASTILFIEGDGDQLSAGVFQTQSSSQSETMARGAIPMVRLAHPHGAVGKRNK